jgi:hypothetical protein
VTRRGQVVGVPVSPADDEAIRDSYAQSLLDSLDPAGKMASQHGITEDELTWLLADDSETRHCAVSMPSRTGLK